MSEAIASNGKALAFASLWALFVGFLVDNWDAIAAAALAVIPAQYAGVAAGLLTLIFKLIQLFFKKPTAPKKIDPNY